MTQLSQTTKYDQTHFCCQFWLHLQEWHLKYPEEFFTASLELVTPSSLIQNQNIYCPSIGLQGNLS